jgi:protein pelota
MKLISKDYRKGMLKARIESHDDLWSLTYVIEKGDVVKGFTFRKIKLGDGERTEVVKKPVVLSIEVEDVDFNETSLRVSGSIREAPEDIPLGSHHTITLEPGSEFTLNKANLLKYQIEKIDDAVKDTKQKILVCCHDREEAVFAMLKKYGYEVLSGLRGDVQKKGDVKAESKDFFLQIVKTLQEYDSRHGFSHIIIASPGFWRDYVQKHIPKDLSGKIVYATCSSAGETGINEVIKRPEVNEVLKMERFASETKLVDELMQEISRNDKGEYGAEQVKKSIASGAVSKVLVTDLMIKKSRQEGKFEVLDRMMRDAESMNGEVHIISSEHEGGKKLDGLGGIGAILRYKVY